MIPALLLLLIALLMACLALFIVFRVLRNPTTSRVLNRLAQGQPQPAPHLGGLLWLDRAFLQAGLPRPSERLRLWLGLWLGAMLLAGLAGGWMAVLA